MRPSNKLQQESRERTKFVRAIETNLVTTPPWIIDNNRPTCSYCTQRPVRRSKNAPHAERNYVSVVTPHAHRRLMFLLCVAARGVTRFTKMICFDSICVDTGPVGGLQRVRLHFSCLGTSGRARRLRRVSWFLPFSAVSMHVCFSFWLPFYRETTRGC